VLQQGFLTKDLTSTTPPTDTLLANRFQVKRFGTRVPLVFETKVKAVLDALEEQTVTAEDVPLAGLPPCGWNKKAVQLRFAAPARVDVVGGFLLKSSPVRPRLTIDVAVEIPDACITPNDHLNYRYHDKRILYLGVLARALQRAGCDATALGGATPLLLSAAEGGVRVRGFGGSAACASASSKPILELRFDARFKCSALTVRIIPTISRVAIPAAKLSPTRCSVRRRHAVADAEAPEAATPHYSNSILEDTCMREHLQHLHSEGSGFDAFARAALLLKVWARQQDLDGASGVSGFFLSMVLLYLVREKKVSRQMRALQLFRVAIRFLVDWLPASIDFWAASQAAQRKAGRTLRPLVVFVDVPSNRR
jgi:U3 small nucleolar RNA-associated protein 22